MTAIPPATHDAPPTHSLIRGPRKQDQSYIASTWVKQLAKVDREGSRGPRYGMLGRQVDAVLDRGDTRALVRHAAGDRDAILGWIVYCEGAGIPLVHFVYVRNEHRGKGYASALLEAIGITSTTSYVFTCRGPSSARMLGKYKAGSHLPLAELLA